MQRDVLYLKLYKCLFAVTFFQIEPEGQRIALQ